MRGTGASNWTAENVLKGRMAEALVDELLRSSGNKVYRFGYEAVLQNLTQIEPGFDRKSEIGQQISSIPDFLVLNQAGKPFFVEVKFRSHLEPLHDDLIGLLKIIEKFWQAKVILVTLQKPYFRIAAPPYFDEKNEPRFEKLEKDPDLNVASEELKNFDSLVERYFVQEAVLAKAQQLTGDLGATAANAARQQFVCSDLIDRVQSLVARLRSRTPSRETDGLIKEILTKSWTWAQSQGTTTAVQLQSWANALLTTELATSLASWTADTFNKNFDKYDELIDKVYNAGEGGGSAIHHLVDGNHTLLGAIRASSKAFDDDSTAAEVMHAVEHLLRDLASRTGINPIFSLTKDQLEALQDFALNLGVSKSWVNDFLQLNVPEVLGAFFAVVPVWFGWSKLDAEKFAEIAGSAGVGALISANPLLGLVALVSMARSFHLLLSKKGEGDLKRAAIKGTFSSLQVSMVYAASAAIPGPTLVGILVGLIVAHALQRYASSGMTHEEMQKYIADLYENKIITSINASTEATLRLFRSLQEKFQFDAVPDPSRAK